MNNYPDDLEPVDPPTEGGDGKPPVDDPAHPPKP